MRCLLVVMILMASIVSAKSSSDPRIPSDSEIRRILSERIDERKQSVGIVVGIVGPEGRRLVAHGHFAADDLRTVNGDTVFEIGSVTKVFTALLLADMARRGEVELTDPVAKYLPEDVAVPQRADKVITLADLASHTSGLPPMPDNLAPMNSANPYADYSVERLYQFLSSHRLIRDIGARWEYSNLGYGLLGYALARRAGIDYESLVHDRILAPLDMESTAITLSAAMQTRLATGHDAALEAVPNWDLPTFAGAGALRSTASDLLTFLEMALGAKESPLFPALTATLATRRPTGIRDETAGFGWIIAKSGDDEMIWHNGGTGGYRSFIGFLPKAKVGVVVLSNTFTEVGVVDYIGQQLLNPDIR
jgi:D-alanyl-D-alanine-carboxypeptidase/D-alanyl-D-alanine-endopeptidase